MLTLTIAGSSVANHIFYAELRAQVLVADYAFRRLAEYGRVQMTKDYTSLYPHPKTPIEVLVDCVTFLTALAVIADVLFPGPTSKAHSRQRATRLRNDLGIGDLPNLSDKKVRNSFMHIDERLDTIVDGHKGDDICLISIARRPAKAPLTLYRVDPATLSICFLGDSLDLKACYAEMMQVASAIKVPIKPLPTT